MGFQCWYYNALPKNKKNQQNNKKKSRFNEKSIKLKNNKN